MSTAAASPALFTSLSALRAAHRDLQREFRAQSDSTELHDRIEAFLHQAQATGAILDCEDDQAAVQSVIDLWVTTLYRAGRQTGDLTLAEFDPSSAPELDDSLAPYIGLASFGEAEREMFFGRQKMIAHLIERLGTENFLAVTGPSGSGKSSLVLAGLLPALRNGQIPGSENWVVAKRVVPGSDPLTNLARCVLPREAEAGWLASQAALMRSDPDHLKKLADAYGEGRTCVFVIDQFEELSTLGADESTRLAVEENLVRLTASNNPRHIVIVTMRSDFIGSVARHPEMQKLLEGLEQVTPMSAPELRDAIERPAERVGLKFEPGVVEQLVHDILGEPAALPLLQFTLLKLWETRERNRVTAAAYRMLGGGRLALTRSADTFYEGLIPEDKVMADRILLRIVRPGQGQDVVSSRIRKTSLYSIGQADRVERVLQKLVAERLVRLTESDGPETAEVEVAHEALVRNWTHLVQLLERERERMTRGRRLEAKAADWVRLGRGKAGLLAGGALVEAQDWINGEDAAIVGAGPDLHALVKESQAAETSAARREFRIKLALIILTIASVSFAVLSLIRRAQALKNEREANKQTEYAKINWNKALKNNDEIKEQARTLLDQRKLLLDQQGLLLDKDTKLSQLARQLDEKAHLYDSDHLADASKKTLTSDPEISTLRALESSIVMNEIGRPDTTETADALREALAANRARLVIGGHEGKVQDAAFTPDGRRVATAGAGKTLQFWNSLNGQAEPLPGAPRASTVAFSLNGDWAADEGTSVRVHFAAGHQPDRLINTEGARVARLAFSPDGRRLAAAAGIQAFVWDLKTTSAPVAFSSHPRPSKINAVALSSDGGFLATASDDESARVYDASTGDLLRELKGHLGPIRDIAFSPNGEIIATAGEDRTAKTWLWVDSSRPDPQPRTFQGHLDVVTSVAFSPDGLKLATGSQDHTAKVWSIQTAGEQFNLPGHTAPIRRVQFNLDGSRLLSAGDDGSVRLWSAGPEVDANTVSFAHVSTVPPAVPTTLSSFFNLPPLPSWPSILVTGGDGRTLVASSTDGSFRIWTMTSEGLTLSKVIHRKSASTEVAINRSAELAATADANGTAILIYDLKSGAVKKELPGPGVKISALALSPDGRSLILGLQDHQLRLLDIDTGQMVRSYGIGAVVTAIAFSPDGNRVVTGSEGGVARVLDSALKVEIAAFTKHAGSLTAIAFSPDGHRIVTGGSEKVAKVWNIDKPSAPPLELAGHTSWIQGVGFSPDGRSVATASVDGTAKLWPISGKNADTEPFTFGGHAGTLCCVTFSQDGKRLITAGYDRTLRVYDLVATDLLALALSRLSRPFIASDCMGQDEPQRCKDMLPTMNEISEGNRLAKAGKVEEARVLYSRALGKGIRVSPADLLARISNENRSQARYQDIEGRIALAHALAAIGDLDRSSQLLNEAVKIRSVEGYGPDFIPAKVQSMVSNAPLYQKLATMLVRTRDDDKHAFNYFKQSLRLVSTQGADTSDGRAKQFMYANLLYVARTEINAKRADRVPHMYARARSFSQDPSRFPETEPVWLNAFCWTGSLQKLYADQDVRDACELAVKLTGSKYSSYVDSRGLNRALNGDFAGAIQDFQQFANDVTTTPALRQDRLNWIAKLKTGSSPFDRDLLERLHREDSGIIPLSPPFY